MIHVCDSPQKTLAVLVQGIHVVWPVQFVIKVNTQVFVDTTLISTWDKALVVLTWPSSSLDLNPTEHLRDVLDQSETRRPQNETYWTWSAANVLVPNTTEYILRSWSPCPWHNYTILGGWYQCYALSMYMCMCLKTAVYLFFVFAQKFYKKKFILSGILILY